MSRQTQILSTRTRAAAAIVTATVMLTGVSGALAGVQDDSGYGSAAKLQSGYGPAGAATAPFETAETRTGATYGSPGLLQLGHGPGGPAAKR